MENQGNNGQSPGREGDHFEDAPDTTPRPSSQSESARSLTGRRESSPSMEKHESSGAPSMPGGLDDLEKNIPGNDGHVDNNGEGGKKSPLLTGHRISVGDMDDVELEDGSSKHTGHSRDSSLSQPPKLPPRDVSPLSHGQQGLSGSLPPVQFPPPPPPPPAAEKPTPPVTTARKLTSPFSWLTSRTTSEKKVVSPPAVAHDRRNTASSVATLSSNPELMLSKIEDGDENEEGGSNKPARNSLRDRFKLLRMREEAGITLEEDTVNGTSQPASGGAFAALIGRTGSIGVGVASPSGLQDEKEGGLAAPQAMQRSNSTTSNTSAPLRTPTFDPKLAPGTASGMSAGPTESAAPVDWDLWQSVVYEGPAAVARTSQEELNHAIAGGIPQAIRGVVWQVLAESKNEALEDVYRELVARGTDKERKPSGISVPSLSRHESHPNGREKDSLASSASSIHSDISTPATTVTTNDGTRSPLPTPGAETNGADPMAKVQAKLIAEKRKKAKDDAAALQKLERTIKKDLGARTSYSKYLMSAGLQDGLFGVCKAYALFDEGVGYAQGMNFIAMPLLFNMPEEEAFSLFVRLMNKYRLRDMFTQDMPGLHLHLYQFERLLEDLEPALYCHLHRRGVNPQLYATQWFLTLFAYRFPLQLVLRIYDLIFSEGIEAILKFGVVLMQKNRDTLLAMKDMAQLTTFLKERLFDVYIDKAPSQSSLLESGFFGSGGDKEVYRADIMVQDACAIKLTPDLLAAYTAEWEEKQQQEKAREAELESLRQSNTSLALKVRTLEERTEKSDAEHVLLASDLVRTKVANERLVDDNESLTTQIAELREIISKQPAEVEERLKNEMDRIMQRNIEVHNENRALEEQLGEMEKELVGAKVRLAQVTEELEGLGRRWREVQGMVLSK